MEKYLNQNNQVSKCWGNWDAKTAKKIDLGLTASWGYTTTKPLQEVRRAPIEAQGGHLDSGHDRAVITQNWVPPKMWMKTRVIGTATMGLTHSLFV